MDGLPEKTEKPSLRKREYVQDFEPFLILSLQLYRSGLKIHAFVFLDSRFRGNDSTGNEAAEKTENLKHDGYICKVLSFSGSFLAETFPLNQEKQK